MILLTNNPYDRKLVMAVGKVPNRILKRSVVNLLKCPPRTGIDAASFAVGDIHVLTACATGLTDCAIAPETAVYKAANNIWVSGGELLGIEASLCCLKAITSITSRHIQSVSKQHAISAKRHLREGIRK